MDKYSLYNEHYLLYKSINIKSILLYNFLFFITRNYNHIFLNKVNVVNICNTKVNLKIKTTSKEVAFIEN